MTLNRSRSVKSLATLLNTAYTTYQRIDLTSNYNTPIFNIGSGSGQSGHSAVPGENFGEWVLTPNQTYAADVQMWGAGGGAPKDSGGGAAGGGGHAKSQITFLKDIPYTIWVGQGGSYADHQHDGSGNRTSIWESGGFGGGGNGGHNAGGGGGMSAIFFNTNGSEGTPGGHSQSLESSFRGPDQSNVILVAGGGGGAGHHAQGHHGQGGGGGGVGAHHGHAQAQTTQVDSGHAWRGTSAPGGPGYRMHGGHGGAASYTGGGGGGYWGGPGGTHHSTHHNGGGGGSGHALDGYSDKEHWNNWIKERYPTLVRGSVLETAPGIHQNHNPNPAATGDIDFVGGVGRGAGHDASHNIFHGGGNGKVVIRVLG
jgi:hypothetical protein